MIVKQDHKAAMKELMAKANESDNSPAPALPKPNVTPEVKPVAEAPRSYGSIYDNC